MTTLRTVVTLTLALALAGLTGVQPSLARGEYDLTHACPAGSDRGHGFVDVGDTHAPGITCLVRYSIAQGRTSTRFDPDAPVTRGQAASMLVGLSDQVGLPSPPSSRARRFPDVDGTTHQQGIERLTAMEPPVLTGFSDGTFRPEGQITRAQFAGMVARLLDGIAQHSPLLDAPDAPAAPRFGDVAAGSTHDDPIHRLAAAGILLGRTAGEFAPAAPISRAQSATTLARVLGGLVRVGLVPAVPPDPGVTERWRPGPGTTWHWQLQGSIDPTRRVQAFNVDGFDTPARMVEQLAAGGRGTICYLSAGSWEEWRPDAHRFPAEVLGHPNGWPGERWLDIRRLDVLGPIMTERMQMCADKGFDAVEPDNIDGAFNTTGFPLTPADQLAYNRWLARTAHDLGLSIGLKNVVEQAAQLAPTFDFAINESCFRWNECEALSVFIDAGKAVFHVEYDLAAGEFCSRANALGFSSMRKRRSLDAWVEPCWS